MSRTRILASMMAMAVALIFSGCLAVWAFPLWVAPPAPSKIDGGVKGGVPGGVVGGVTGGVEGGVTEGVANGLTGEAGAATKHEHHVDVRRLNIAHIVNPHYPPLAKQAGVQGVVVIDISVNDKGDVTGARVVSGPDQLAQAALDAVKQWKYEPSPLLPASTTVDINFTLAEKEKKSESTREESETAPSGTKVYTIGRDVKAPTPVADPNPPYTPEARKAKLNGTAVFTIIVNEHGDVTDVKETSKPLGKGLDESATKTIRGWKFQPALREGKPVAVRMMAKVTFRYF